MWLDFWEIIYVVNTQDAHSAFRELFGLRLWVAGHVVAVWGWACDRLVVRIETLSDAIWVRKLGRLGHRFVLVYVVIVMAHLVGLAEVTRSCWSAWLMVSRVVVNIHLFTEILGNLFLKISKAVIFHGGVKGRLNFL